MYYSALFQNLISLKMLAIGICCQIGIRCLKRRRSRKPWVTQENHRKSWWTCWNDGWVSIGKVWWLMLKSMNLSTFFHTFSNDNAPPITSTFQNSSHESFIVINDTNNETFASCTSLVTWDGWNGRRTAVVSLFRSVKMCKLCSLLFQLPSHDIECLALATNVQPAIGSTPDSLPGWWHRYAPWLHVGLRPSITAGRKVCRKKSQLSGVRLDPWIPGHIYMVWSWSVERWGLGSFPVERWAHVLWTSLDHVIPEPLQQLLYSLFRYRDGLRCSRGTRFRSWINVLLSIYLGQWHRRDFLPALQGFRISSEWFAACHNGDRWVFRGFRFGSGHQCSARAAGPTPRFSTALVSSWFFSKWTSSTSQYFWGVQMNSKPETPKVTYFQFPQFNGQDAYRHSLWVTLHVWSWLIMFGHHFWCSKMFQTWFKHVETLSFLSDCSSSSCCCAWKFFREIAAHGFLSVQNHPFLDSSKMFVILRPWQDTLPGSAAHAFFRDDMIVLVELYLGQWQ